MYFQVYVFDEIAFPGWFELITFKNNVVEIVKNYVELHMHANKY
jgi:hypothetical protein